MGVAERGVVNATHSGGMLVADTVGAGSGVKAKLETREEYLVVSAGG